MSTKLRNIDAIKKMLDGSHRTQTKHTVVFGEASKHNETHEVGDIWVDEAGVEWEQRNGFKIQKGKLDAVRSLIAATRLPAVCPKCNTPMTNRRLDEKFWKLDGHCFNCQVEYEHNLRIEGKFEEYETQRILQNAEAWLREAEQEAIELAAAFRNPLTYTTVDGIAEHWHGGPTGDEIASKIEAEFKMFKEKFIETLKTPNT
jgi:ribosomal protein L37AE/L43A